MRFVAAVQLISHMVFVWVVSTACMYAYIYIYNIHICIWSPPDAYEASLLYCQHNLLHAALRSEEPKTL